MRVLVTGSTGWIGQSVVQELIQAGHQVVGLCRSDEKAKQLTAAGAEPLKGSLEDLEGLKKAAADSDGVIHLAFDHDFTRYIEATEKDRAAIGALASGLAGSNKPLIITSGTLMLSDGHVVTEADTPNLKNPIGAARGASEAFALAFVEKGVRVQVVRLPPTNHDAGDHGFVAILVGIARAKGVSAYIGEGSNRWPAVHRLDAARVYRLALEKGEAGSVFHAVADEGVPFKDIAAAIGKGLNVPVVSKPPSEVQEHFGWLVMAVPRDNTASSARTREQLGWSPQHPSLLEDLAGGDYFKTE
jgi:nucleoside-diphosphate-sugar epimerase